MNGGYKPDSKTRIMWTWVTFQHYTKNTAVKVQNQAGTRASWIGMNKGLCDGKDGNVTNHAI